MAAIIPVRGDPILSLCPQGLFAPTSPPVHQDRSSSAYFFSPASTKRVICHCCAMDKRLFTVL